MPVFHAKTRFDGGKTIAGFLLALLTVAAVAVGVRTAAERSRDEGVRVLENNLHRAAVQCYALEGFYPPSIAYLEENMGVVIDHDRYAVYYEGFASNVMPEITVVLKYGAVG